MTDSHLRELDRRFRASDGVEDEAAWLRARVRAGDLEQSKVELAAYLGHDAALCLLGALPPPAALSESWIMRLGAWGDLCRARACLTLGRFAQAHLPLLPGSQVLGEAHHLAVERVLSAFEDWIRCPCEAHEHETRRLQGPCYLAMFATEAEGCPPMLAIYSVIYAVRCTNAHRSAGHVEAILRMLSEAGLAVQASVMREALLPWVLGYSDPVRERVEARQRGSAARD